MTGERLLAGLFGLFGVLWIVQSSGLRYWSDFAPGSGFFPFWLGVILTALVVLFLLQSFRTAPAATAKPAAAGSTRKIALIVGALVVCVTVIELLGYGVTMAAFLVFLLGYVEKRSPVVTVGVALGTTLGLYLVFRAWLGVPLPQGPWGF